MRLIMATLATIALLASGCTTDGDVEPDNTTDLGSFNGEVRETPIELKDGRTVTCLVFVVDRGGGLDCDWEGAR